MHSLAIIALSILTAVSYGIVHDQITARVCVEYFTIGHPPVFGTDDPTLLGLGWGVIATWWAGLLLGVPLALAARAGSRPKRSLRSLIRPVAVLVAVMSVVAFGAGVTGWWMASRGHVWLAGHLAKEVPRDRHVLFLADLWAHSASYFMGFVGGFVVVARVWFSRGRRSEVLPS